MGVTGGGVTVVITGQDDTSKVLDQIEERMRRAAIPAADLGRNLGDGMAHAVPQVAAASAAIRTLEGAIPIRAVERLLTIVPGGAAALQALFLPIAAFDTGRIAFDVVEKIYNIGKAALEAGQKAREGFAGADDRARVLTDDLAIQNQKLQDEIDKLSGHPNDGLRTALLEAKKAADSLLDSLQNDRKELESLLKEHSVGVITGALTGVSSTGTQEDQLLKDQLGLTEKVRKANDDYAAVVLNTDDRDAIKQATETRNGAIKSAYQSQIDALVTESGRLKKQQEESARAVQVAVENGAAYTPPEDNSAKIANVEGRAQQLRRLMERENLTESIAAKQDQVGPLRQNKEQGELDQKAAEAARKQEESRRQMQDAQAKLAESVSKLQQVQAEEQVRQAKAGADEEMAVLDASYKMKLVSEEDYYRKRQDIQERYAGAQVLATSDRIDAVNTQIAGLNSETFNGPDADAKRVERNAQVNAKLVERVKLESQLAVIEAESNKRATDTDSAVKLAQQRQPEEDYQNATANNSVLRANLEYRRRRGLVSGPDAVQQGHAIDAKQADDMQALADSYQKRIATGVDPDTAAALTVKIKELREQILELRNPIDETAEALRAGFDSAFEGLFENIDQGSKAFENFAKSIQRTLTQQVYKELIQPQIDGVLRQAAGSVSGAIRPQSKLPSGVDPLSIVRPAVPAGVGGVLGDVLGDKGKSQNITIVLQQDTTGAAKVTDVFADGNNRDHIIATVAGDISSGGILRQLLGHGL